jgi:hypothetical protein
MENFQEYGWEDTIENEGSEFVLLPEGDYDFTVTKIERTRHNGSEKMPACNMAKVTVTVWGQQDKIEIVENLFLCNKMEWKLSQFFLSIGLKKHGEPLRMNWTAAQGRQGKCHVYVDNFKDKKSGEDRQSNKIKKFYAYDEQIETLSPKGNTTQQPYQQTYQQPAAGGWKAGSF